MWIQLNLVLLLIIRNGFSFEGLFDALDLHMLDDIDFCQIQLDPNLSIELFESSHYITFDEKHSCEPTLVVKRLEVEELFQDHKFIKDPEKTFLFLNDQETIPEPISVKKYQPYYFVATKYSTEIWIQEIQVYVGKVERVVVLNKTNHHGWKMDESTFQSVESRRSNFHGITLKAHYESFLKTDGFIDEDGNFLGYNGEIGNVQL